MTWYCTRHDCTERRGTGECWVGWADRKQLAKFHLVRDTPSVNCVLVPFLAGTRVP